MDRRDFLRFLAALPLLQVGSAWGKRAPVDLVVAHGPDPSLLLPQAFEALGGMRRYVRRGDVVLIKPNMAWDRGPEYAANTNPRVVAALVRLALDAGARRVKVFDHTCEDPRRVYRRSGIMEAAKRAGAEVSYVNPRRFRRVMIGGEVLKEWEVYQDALEVDRIINVPVLKHHSLARLTMGMKNLMGLIGGKRSQLHWRLGESLADLAAFFKPDLVVLDATRVLLAGGPQGGNMRNVRRMDTIVIGKDQVAVDTWGARIFGIEPEEVSCIPIAHRRGLGEMDLRRVRTKRIGDVP